ncbi:isocyanide synthase family protein [Legionella erythra]|uniref:Pyoverdine biosynthesis protein PvcA n=1 Tax=Legionella erythra TaxID=448 RepID=A0A0W0TQE7_LEGER|nr:isocyanide synthase family protein [Legionella erythra]KTC97721.1 pyoverdine biosynthesis protein PvcA [Legionella erythra]
MNDMNHDEVVNELTFLLMNRLRSSEPGHSACRKALCPHCQHHPRQYLTFAIQRQLPLVMILPAFPAKSANRKKTLSPHPDRGEVMGLSHLNALCASMQQTYSHGVKLIICSDGRVFNDLVLVSDEDVDIYQRGIKQIIKDNQLNHLSTFSLDDIYDSLTYTRMRERLMMEYAESLPALLTRIEDDPALLYQFNGIHRFIVEDQLALHPGLSKNQIRKQAKSVAYEVIRRSNAWSRLLAKSFPNSLRLSIHPQPCGSDKLGIQFLPASNQWATPWHNVMLKRPNGWQLVKRQEAEQLGARLNHDHYVLEAC